MQDKYNESQHMHVIHIKAMHMHDKYTESQHMHGIHIKALHMHKTAHCMAPNGGKLL